MVINNNAKKSKNVKIRNSIAEFLIFTSQSVEDSIEVKVADENIWLTQKHVFELFGKSVSTVSEHIKNIYREAKTMIKIGNSEFAKDFELSEFEGDLVCRQSRYTEQVI